MQRRTNSENVWSTETNDLGRNGQLNKVFSSCEDNLRHRWVRTPELVQAGGDENEGGADAVVKRMFVPKLPSQGDESEVVPDEAWKIALVHLP
jgi:hypothetical protein